MSENPFEEPEYVFRSVKQLEFHKFEKLGEAGVRSQMAKGHYGGQRLGFAREWLSGFEEERNFANETRRDKISEEHLRLAEEANALAAQANETASRANTNATIASIIAVIAIAVSIVTAFVSN